MHERDFIKDMSLPEDRAFFVYKGRSSHEFGIIVSPETPFISPERDVVKHEIDGRSGVLTEDKGRYKNVNYPVKIYLTKEEDFQEQVYRVSNWLKSDVHFQDLFLSWDSNYIHTAMLNTSFEIQQLSKYVGQVTLSFDCHPTKKRRDGLIVRDIQNGSKLLNPETQTADPTIEIAGTGDVKLYFITDREQQILEFKDLDKPIIVECGRKIVYDKMGMPSYEKIVSRQLPVLQVGETTISWTGNVSSIQIMPRWEGLLP